MVDNLLENDQMVRIVAGSLQDVYAARTISTRTVGILIRMLKVVQWTTNQILMLLAVR
jgi:hypothetical protein